MMFDRLKALRDKLASIPAFACDPDTRAALVEAIDELDDAMVMDTRAQQYVKDHPPFDLTAHTNELLALFAGATTCGELTQC